MQKINLVIIVICYQLTNCNINGIEDIKTIEGMWEIYSVSSNGEVFYPRRISLVDYYSLNSIRPEQRKN